jgi:hypothetical protein
VQVSPGNFFVAGNYWHFKEKFGIKGIVIHAETVSPQDEGVTSWQPLSVYCWLMIT